MAHISLKHILFLLPLIFRFCVWPMLYRAAGVFWTWYSGTLASTRPAPLHFPRSLLSPVPSCAERNGSSLEGLLRGGPERSSSWRHYQQGCGDGCQTKAVQQVSSQGSTGHKLAIKRLFSLFSFFSFNQITEFNVMNQMLSLFIVLGEGSDNNAASSPWMKLYDCGFIFMLS